ncbi:multidrug resistance-associated ABC transporter [Suillus clintonianus]|uniref:multidrug resistance-associated ABC transporter n=1 Tax=Suillus clintonianus TaxID=1904413 RepID=UPI001B876361|nr:multidrug resistance-associated ABC transporter [Suillus clintonianus]KAG2142476.1 multidrug resistance-associated ABC transporter [Suillus clintonianus]
MPPYQLLLAEALVGGATISCFALFLAQSQQQKIRLPTTQDASLANDVNQDDPFNVTKPEDFINGEPIDEDAFWFKMRNRKLLLVFLSAVILVLEGISLGWSAYPDGQNMLTEHIFRTTFALYVGVLAVRSVGQSTTDNHSESMIHITALTFFSSVLHFAAAILPSSDSILTRNLQAFPSSLAFWYSMTVLYTLAFAIVATAPRGPPLHFSPSLIYSQKTIHDTTNESYENVSGLPGTSVIDFLFFRFVTRVIHLGSSVSVEIGDLPILPMKMRATYQFFRMRMNLRRNPLKPGWDLAWRLINVNKLAFGAEILLAAAAAPMWFGSPFFVRKLIAYLEDDPERLDKGWGWVYAFGQFASLIIVTQLNSQMWNLATSIIQIRLRMQLNTMLFAKTLVRKDVVSSAGSGSDENNDKKSKNADGESKDKAEEENEFSSKAQVMTLMTTDVDRVAEFPYHLFAIADSPIEIVVGTTLLYSMLGVSCFIGLAVICLFLPLNHFAGKVVISTQDNLMKARDERVSLMNEILGGIRMLKFMAWERSFEKRVLKIRERELKYQKLNYRIEVVFAAIWEASPLIVTLVSFWHFAVWRQQTLTPSIAFTSMLVFNEMRFAMNALPETFINLLQVHVSLKRIGKYLQLTEVAPVPPLSAAPAINLIAVQSASITWPHDRSADSSAASTPRHKFMLVDLALKFPEGQLSLVCGKLGSGKTLLLLALLGEADVLTGQVICPRSPPDALASFADQKVTKEEWIVPGVCAYVPQAAWLRNASIKDNILFGLPFDEERYQKTLEICALISDLMILEDGDQSEIGERGVNLSGGQKARVSLARAVYSRASILLLDDVLSAVDAHTAHHIYYKCIKGELMHGRTVILVSHHVQLCLTGASYVVALDNGHLLFAGEREAFDASPVKGTLVQTMGGTSKKQGAASTSRNPAVPAGHSPVATLVEDGVEPDPTSETSSTVVNEPQAIVERKAPRKLVEDEKRAVGRVSRDVWELYVKSCGAYGYWAWFLSILVLGALCPVAENWWLKIWSGSSTEEVEAKGPVYYIVIYAVVTLTGVFISTYRYFVLYNGSIHASAVLYQKLLETVLFANIRFHDTVSRGRLLNRFGKDFEGIDSRLSDSFGRSIIFALTFIVMVLSVTLAGGVPFLIAIIFLGFMYFNVAKDYGQAARDMRRLDSVARSPLYSIYGETIAGAPILRAFGASSKFLRDMLRCVDTNTNPNYWQWAVNRWLSARFDLLSAATVGVTGLIAVSTPTISAALAGFALSFAGGMTWTLLFLVRRFVGLEQSMVALERVKEYSELKREPPEFIEPRPPTSWPDRGAIKCENLIIRYAPDLPDVLHNLNFEIHPGEKVGILGRTGSGKSTLALSFFRFVEATEGCITIDNLDISKMGLSDLRSKLTIIPQDPTILSGTLRSTLDVFDEYEDAEIFESLRRVHLIPSDDVDGVVNIDGVEINVNVFRNLDSPVSEGGENFSTGEKQLLCMARAILKRSKVLVMDEATASVDYATDELIGKTIRQEFANSTILTIAHRLRTVIDYDRVILLDQGKIVEFDRPAVLLSDPSSQFYGLCEATGENEFAMLKNLAGL